MATKQSPASASTSRPIGTLWQIRWDTGDVHVTACPECDAPAELTHYATLASTDGPIDMVRITCPAKHWFLMTADLR